MLNAAIGPRHHSKPGEDSAAARRPPGYVNGRHTARRSAGASAGARANLARCFHHHNETHRVAPLGTNALPSSRHHQRYNATPSSGNSTTQHRASYMTQYLTLNLISRCAHRRSPDRRSYPLFNPVLSPFTHPRHRRGFNPYPWQQTTWHHTHTGMAAEVPHTITYQILFSIGVSPRRETRRDALGRAGHVTPLTIPGSAYASGTLRTPRTIRSRRRIHVAGRAAGCVTNIAERHSCLAAQSHAAHHGLHQAGASAGRDVLCSLWCAPGPHVLSGVCCAPGLHPGTTTASPASTAACQQASL